MVPNVEQT